MKLLLQRNNTSLQGLQEKFSVTFNLSSAEVGRPLQILYWDSLANDGQGAWVALQTFVAGSYAEAFSDRAGLYILVQIGSGEQETPARAVINQFN